MPDELVLDFDDGYGIRCTLTKKNWEKHKKRHPEMGRRIFLHDNIPDAVKEPDFIFPSHNDPSCYCFYRQHCVVVGITWYTKVVVQKYKKTYIIRTGWHLNNVHELKYNSQPLINRP